MLYVSFEKGEKMVAITVEKLYKEIKELKKETREFRKLILFLIADPEGEYKEEFVRRILKKSQEKPEFTFSDKKSFLEQIS